MDSKDSYRIDRLEEWKSDVDKTLYSLARTRRDLWVILGCSLVGWAIYSHFTATAGALLLGQGLQIWHDLRSGSR